MDNLTYEQREWVIQRIVQWYQIREENGFERDPTMPDVDHSALLRLLLEGMKPHKYPPPRSYSYPNYYAVEHETIPQEIWFKRGSGEYILSDSIPFEEVETTDVVPGMLGIDHGLWKVLRREGKNLIIECTGKDPAEWVLRLRSQEEIGEATSVIVSEKRNRRWALKRIPPEE